jgi:hypothetical protein
MAATKNSTTRKSRNANYAPGEHYKPCPWSINENRYQNGQLNSYRAFCTNKNNPNTSGGKRTLVTKDAKMCLGGTIGGRTYRDCPYYKRMTKDDKVAYSKKAKKAHRHYALFGDPMTILVVIVIIITIIAMMNK